MLLSRREVALHLPVRILFPQHSEINTFVIGQEAMFSAVGFLLSQALQHHSVSFSVTNKDALLIDWGQMWHKQSCPVDNVKPDTIFIFSLRQQVL